VLRHQLGHNLVLGLDLLLQVGDPLRLGGGVRPCFLLEGSNPVLEELLLSIVEDGGLQAEFIAELDDRLLLRQMPPPIQLSARMNATAAAADAIVRT
jgi:hypothetical protein